MAMAVRAPLTRRAAPARTTALGARRALRASPLSLGAAVKPRVAGRLRSAAGVVAVRAASTRSNVGLPDPSPENVVTYTKAFFQPDWAHHREHLRFIRHLMQGFSSRVLRYCLPMVMIITLGTAALCQWAPPTLKLPMLPFTLTSFVMSLLLVFRTNTSYARWWEARILWGGTVNTCRTLGREILCSLRASNPMSCSRGLRLVIAYVYSLRAHLQGLSDANIENTLSTKLSADECRMIMDSKHRPGACLHALGQVIRNAKERGEMDNITHLFLSERVHGLTDGMGACERILRTPIPLSYTRHTSRFLILWLAFLPLALRAELGWISVPVMAMTSMLLIGVDEIGVQIEEPFRSLPLESICNTIEASVVGYSKEHDDLNVVMASNVAGRVPESAVQMSTGVMQTVAA